jgi:hypothetical protein
MLQAERPELFRSDLATLQLLDALFKAADFRFNRLAAVSFFDFG